MVAFAKGLRDPRHPLAWMDGDRAAVPVWVYRRSGCRIRISDVLRQKGPAVATIAPSATVHELVSTLRAHNIGAMVVTEGEAVVGISFSSSPCSSEVLRH